MVLGLSPPLGDMLSSFSGHAQEVEKSFLNGNGNNGNNGDNGENGDIDSRISVGDTVRSNNNNNNNYHNNSSNNCNNSSSNNLTRAHSTTSLNLYSGNFSPEKTENLSLTNTVNAPFTIAAITANNGNNVKSVKLVTKSNFRRAENTKVLTRNKKPVLSTAEKEMQQCTGKPVLVSRKKSDSLLR